MRTPSRSRSPDSARATLTFSAVCPPRVGNSASGFSRSMTCSTDAGVQRLDVGAVGELRVGHDRGGVRVDERRPRTRRRAAPCTPGSPSSRTRRPARSRSAPSRSPGSCARSSRRGISARSPSARGTRSNRYRASCGPGAASGWYCTPKAGTSRQRMPSSVPSLRFQCSGRRGRSRSSATPSPSAPRRRGRPRTRGCGS